MAKRGGGFPGMGGGMNPQQMMMKVQRLQQEMAKAQEEIDSTEVSASAGGGMVTVKMTGNHKMTGIEIKPEAVDPEDVEMLQDLILAAFNEAASQVEALHESKMSAFGGGAPGLF